MISYHSSANQTEGNYFDVTFLSHHPLSIFIPLLIHPLEQQITCGSGHPAGLQGDNRDLSPSVFITILSTFSSPLIVLTSPDQTCPSLYRRHLLSGPSHRNFPMHFLPTIKIFSQTEIVPKLSQMVCVVSKILLIRICHALT